MELFRRTALTPTQIAELRRLSFQTDRLVDTGIAGEYRSAFRGQGIEFEEVREYQVGDDVRAIDWKVSARMRRPFVKVYREERELTVLVAVDVSGSTYTGTAHELRASVIARIGAVLTLIALRNNDKVGLVTFSNKLETYHPPRKARGSVWNILHDVLAPVERSAAHMPEAQLQQTDLHGLLTFCNQVLHRRAIVFVLSDFFATDYQQALGLLAKRHDVTLVVAGDPADSTLPESGLLDLVEPESGRRVLIDTANSLVREAYRKASIRAHEQLVATASRYGVGLLETSTAEDFLPRLKRYLQQKGRRHQRWR